MHLLYRRFSSMLGRLVIFQKQHVTDILPLIITSGKKKKNRERGKMASDRQVISPKQHFRRNEWNVTRRNNTILPLLPVNVKLLGVTWLLVMHSFRALGEFLKKEIAYFSRWLVSWLLIEWVQCFKNAIINVRLLTVSSFGALEKHGSFCLPLFLQISVPSFFKKQQPQTIHGLLCPFCCHYFGLQFCCGDPFYAKEFGLPQRHRESKLITIRSVTSIAVGNYM